MSDLLDIERVYSYIRSNGTPEDEEGAINALKEGWGEVNAQARALVAAEREQWVAAFTAYRHALSQPVFDQDDESRASNRQEVQRCFDALCALMEGE